MLSEMLVTTWMSWPPFLVVTFPQYVAASSGTRKADLTRLCSILESVPEVKYICLDVANGYSEHFVECVKTVRGRFPDHTIMVRSHVFVIAYLMLSECVLSRM